MAAYEAIRDSFREFNRTLIDSQQWNAQHESRMADQQLKETMLMNQLNQQTFSNRMEQERLRLSGQSNNIGAERLAEQIRNNQARFDADQKKWAEQYQLEQDKINNLKTDRAIKNKLAAEKNREAKETADLLQKQTELTNAKLMRDADTVAKSNVPTRVIIPPTVINNPEVYDKVADEILIKTGGSIGEDNVVLDKHGKELMLPLHEQLRFNYKIKALEAVHDNKPKRMQDEMEILLRTKSNNESRMKNMRSSYAQHERASIKQQNNKMDAKIKEYNKYLDSLDTPQGQAAYHRYKAKNIRTAAAKLSSKELGNDPGVAKQFIAIAEEEEALAATLIEAENKRQLELTKGEQSERKGVLTENQMLNVEDVYKISTPAGVMLSDAVKPKIGTVKNVINIRYNKGNKTDADRLNYREDTVAKIDEYETKYHNSIEELSQLSRQEVDQFIKLYNIEPENNSKSGKLQALKNLTYRTFRDDVRKLAGDDSIMVYRPNKSTNKMKYLGQ